MRHTNTLTIADRGFPFWPGIETVDLSLVDDVPTVLQVLAGLFSYGKLTMDPIWVKPFIFSGILYLTIRYLKKKTKVLARDNR